MVIVYQPFEPCDHEPPSGDVDLVIFPELVDGDVGIYRSTMVPLKKQLAEAGIRADYAHPPERRRWLREYSAAERAIDLAIGLTSSGATLGIQFLLARKRPSFAKVKITTARKVRGKRMWDAEVVEFEGSSEDVSAAIEAWKDSSSDE